VTTRSPTKKAATRRRKPWQRPRVKSGRLFESNSLSCNKLPADQMCQESPPVTSS